MYIDNVQTDRDIMKYRHTGYHIEILSYMRSASGFILRVMFIIKGFESYKKDKHNFRGGISAKPP